MSITRPRPSGLPFAAQQAETTASAAYIPAMSSLIETPQRSQAMEAGPGAGATRE